jgi:two-component system, cell cycle sensor histidine kinase and response regulator CckA
MGFLKRASLAWRLTALVGVAFAVTVLAAFALMDGAARSVLLQRNLDLRTRQLETVLRRVDRPAPQLQPQPALRREVALQELTLQLEHDHHVVPFVIDRERNLETGRPIARQHRERLHAGLAPFSGAQEGGSFVFRDDQHHPHWAIVRPHRDGQWALGVALPRDLLLADAHVIRQRLIVVWVVVTVLVLSALAWLLRRELRPLRDLTRAAAAMADGDLQEAVAVDGSGEVGVLSRSFLHMREAIGRQLAALRESEGRYRLIFDAMSDGVLLLDQDGTIAAANPRVADAYGWTPAQLTGRPVTCLLREGDVELARLLRNPPADAPLTLSARTCDREQRERETEIRAVRLTFQGRPHALIILHDLSSQRRLERQFLQSQRLESVARLAGGIAHDFNNLLTPVLGYSEMLLASGDLGPEARKDVEAIRRAGERARSMARQLLAFSRRQEQAPAVLDLVQTVKDFEPILRRTLSEDIELVCTYTDGPSLVEADPGRLEQVLMNLAVNAMDALPGGGRLELSVAIESIAAGPEQQTHLACLRIRDDGPGIPDHILDHVCEPYFTTKEAGHGLGLGLSTAREIVQQYGGTLTVRNHELGGCEVTVLLPCAPVVVTAGGPGADASERRSDGQGETVVLVEDDDMVRRVLEILLVKHGYAVRSYPGGMACLDDLIARPTPADVVLTDVVMPGMSGPQLRDRLQDAGIVLPTVFMSGYASEILLQRGLSGTAPDFLQKPLTPPQLLQVLRQALARSSAPPAP